MSKEREQQQKIKKRETKDNEEVLNMMITNTDKS